MIKNQALFEKLIVEALHREFTGWDFSFLENRYVETPPSWDYHQRVLAQIKSVASLLDMGTGGGEFLSTLAPLPPTTCATEAYQPNVPIARSRLEPLGVRVFEIRSDESLPFENERFDLVINRHESFSSSEVFRILKPGGKFITQQVGGHNNRRLNELIQGLTRGEHSFWTSREAVARLRDTGFQILEKKEEFPEAIFYDIGAIVFYLRVIPWQIPDFKVEKYHDKLVAIHNAIQETGSLTVKTHRFYIEALKK